MIVKRKKETGALAIDAAIGLCVFIMTILAIMFLSLLIRVQANMQYALGQTAKEISGYFYFLDKMGFTSVVTGVNDTATQEDADTINKNIKVIADFTGGVSNAAYDVASQDSLQEMIDSIGNSAGQLEQQANDLWEMIKGYNKDDIVLHMQVVLKIFGKTLINRAFGEAVAPIACKFLLPKYLTSGDIDEYYAKMGMKDVKFSGSELLKDGRSIKLVASYKLDVSKFTFGMVDKELNFQQVVTTAAWVKPNSTGSVKKIREVIESPSEPDT